MKHIAYVGMIGVGTGITILPAFVGSFVNSEIGCPPGVIEFVHQIDHGVCAHEVMSSGSNQFVINRIEIRR